MNNIDNMFKLNNILTNINQFIFFILQVSCILLIDIRQRLFGWQQIEGKIIWLRTEFWFSSVFLHTIFSSYYRIYDIQYLWIHHFNNQAFRYNKTIPD